MDKGPHPAECAELAHASGFKTVAANHEERHIRWRKHYDLTKANPSYVNPMTRPMSEIDMSENLRLSSSTLNWLQAAPAVLQPCPEWVAVHGGLMPNIPLSCQPKENIMRLRYLKDGKPVQLDHTQKERIPKGAQHWTEVYDGSYNVVYGHEAHSLSVPRKDTNPMTGATYYGIDTGCVHGGRLTALIVNTSSRSSIVSFVSVPSRKVYHPPLWDIPA